VRAGPRLPQPHHTRLPGVVDHPRFVDCNPGTCMSAPSGMPAAAAARREGADDAARAPDAQCVPPPPGRTPRLLLACALVCVRVRVVLQGAARASAGLIGLAASREGDGGKSACGTKRAGPSAAQEAMRKVRARQEEQQRKEELLRDKESVLEHGRHPYGVQPMGNMFADGAQSSIRGGLGAFSPVGDQAVLDLLEMLDARQLGRLTCCSRALYVYCHHADIWRSLVLKVFGGNFEFTDNWKDTFGCTFLKQDYVPHVPRKVSLHGSAARCCTCVQSTHRTSRYPCHGRECAMTLCARRAG